MSRQFGREKNENEMIANVIGTIIFAIIVLVISIEWDIVFKKIGGLFE
tara:strand:- start:586 stop:729 length:144 start_codon:yes stop_codon:yes gene_type:complete